MPLLTDSLPLVRFGIPFFQDFDQITGSKSDSRILLTGKGCVEWMEKQQAALIKNYLVRSGYGKDPRDRQKIEKHFNEKQKLNKKNDNTKDEVTYDIARKTSAAFVGESNPPYLSPGSKLAELMMKLTEEAKGKLEKGQLAAQLSKLVLDIKPNAPPSEVTDHHRLLEEAFWLAGLYLVPRTYTIQGEESQWKATNCLMCNALTALEKDEFKFKCVSPRKEAKELV
jgi:hypothetical protein